MFKYLLCIICTFFCLASVASGSDVIVDLDKPVKADLLSSSEYFLDSNDSHDMDSAKLHPDSQWTPFNRKQFRFGLMKDSLWVRTTLKTAGEQGRELLIDLHGVIDNIHLQIRTPDNQETNYKFGKGSKPIHEHEHKPHFFNIGQKADTDHVVINLAPNKTYELLLNINSNNAVIGSYRVIEPSRLDSENRLRANAIVGYLFLTFLILFYSCLIYASTHDKAFIFHMLYTLSITGYLLNSYSFIEAWFGITDNILLQKLLTVSVALIFLSLLAFCKAIVGKKFSLFPRPVKVAYQIFLAAGSITLCLIFVFPYEIVIRFLIVELVLAMVLAPFMAFYRPEQHNRNSGIIDTRILRLRITLLTFTFVGGVHMSLRLGLINVYWFTNYILFLFVFIEVFLFITVIFININNDKKALHRETYFNRYSKLPNDKSLKNHVLNNTTEESYTLVYFWVSGFDRLEIALGGTRFREFITKFGLKLSNSLKDSDYVVTSNDGNEGFQNLFHTGKNNFAILCERLSYKDQRLLYKQITEASNHLGHLNHFNVDFKVIIGADGFYPKADSYEIVMENCLLALAHGIKNKTNIKYYDDSIRADKLLRRKLVADFEKALKNNDLYLVWQPQLELKTKRILGVEVFSRWLHEEKGLILPNTYIPLLEKSDRICQLSRWTIEEVFKSLPLIHESFPSIEVSINLSPQDLLTDDLISFLDDQLIHYADLAPYVILEITESVMIDDYSIALGNIKELQLRGFKVSIENFGSGLASFSYLQSVPTNELKIDKTFSDRFAEPKTQAILSSITGLANRLNIRLVVEGLEREQQIHSFTNLGVGRLQGWAISEPLALSDLLKNVSVEPEIKLNG
jgi:EAL domain-containing protein (putative c-di-GMP-specific phosphodiesterase class I)